MIHPFTPNSGHQFELSPLGRTDFKSCDWFRRIGEYEIVFGPGTRIYLARDGLKFILLIGGGTKKRQQQDIELAVALWEDFKRRKASN